MLDLGYNPVLYHQEDALSFGFYTRDISSVGGHYVSYIDDYPVGIVTLADETLYIVHPLPPFNDMLYKKQKHFFAALSDMLREKSDFLVV